MRKTRFLLSTTMASFCLLNVYSCNFNTPTNEALETAQAGVLVHPEPEKQFVKIALLLDTSNSMDGLINQAKAQLWDIVNEFAYAKCGNDQRPELQIALYEYGNDNLSSREGYLRQVLPFSSDLDDISEKLFSLSTNGGEEYCGTVINTSLKQLDWGKNQDDLKLIFIAGNEPFTQGGLNYKDAASQAKEKDVVVNTIFCGNYAQGIATQWKDGAIRTGGDYMAIDHNAEQIYVHTPYDNQIMRLNSKLNQTYVAYGSLGNAKLQKQREQDSNAYEVEAEVAVNRAVSKSSKMYKNSSWDLVDAVEDKAVSVSELEEDALPNELRGKTDEEINTILKKRKAEREKLQSEIQKLNGKREIYIAKQANKGGELENAMLNAIKKQAAKKHFRWEK